MKERFEETKRRFNNIFQETRNSCEDILLEVLKENPNNGNILVYGGVTVNTPNYDNEWDEAFCVIENVILQDSIDSDEKVVIFQDDSHSYELEIDDVSIEELLLITEFVLKNIK